MVIGPESCPADCLPEVWRLFCAAANGELDTVQSILRETPELMHSFLWYETPLHYAVRENQIGIVRELLDRKINPAYSNFNYSSWQSLLPIAQDREYHELHQILLVEMQQRFNYDPAYKPLWQAIAAGQTAEVRSLISDSPQLVHIGDEHGNRALHWAILSRRIPIIQMLLDAGADINAPRADMQSPLHLALEGDYWFGKKNSPDANTTAKDVAEYIRDHGANYEFAAALVFNDIPHVQSELARQPELATQLNDARRSPLFLAAKRGHIELVRILLQHGADPNLPEHCAGSGRALFAASARNDIEMMKLLIDHGANADAYVDSCGNCLSIAQQGGDREAEAIALLTEHGALPGEWELDTQEKVAAAIDDETFIPNRDMWSSIVGTILSQDSVELADKYVARFGTDEFRRLNPSNGWRMPKSGQMLQRLLQYGMNINARDWFGRTYLHHSAHFETTDVAEFLIAAEIDINAIDHQSGTTALGLAAWHGNFPMVKCLLDAGADAALPANRTWAQPLSFAKKQGHKDVVDFLESRAQIDARRDLENR